MECTLWKGKLFYMLLRTERVMYETRNSVQYQVPVMQGEGGKGGVLGRVSQDLLGQGNRASGGAEEGEGGSSPDVALERGAPEGNR